MLTDEAHGVTVENVRRQLAELEATYKRQRKTKLALLRALEAERATEPEATVAAED